MATNRHKQKSLQSQLKRSRHLHIYLLCGVAEDFFQLSPTSMHLAAIWFWAVKSRHEQPIELLHTAGHKMAGGGGESRMCNLVCQSAMHQLCRHISRMQESMINQPQVFVIINTGGVHWSWHFKVTLHRLRGQCIHVMIRDSNLGHIHFSNRYTQWLRSVK
jgi:hypothetical protein